MAEKSTGSRSPLLRVLVGIAWAVVLVLVALAIIRVFIRPVAPGQESPPGHFGNPCTLCHIVSGEADIIGFGE